MKYICEVVREKDTIHIVETPVGNVEVSQQNDKRNRWSFEGITVYEGYMVYVCDKPFTSVVKAVELVKFVIDHLKDKKQ